MNSLRRITFAAISLVLAYTASVVGGAIAFTVPIATVDAGAAWQRLPTAVHSAYVAIEDALVAFGLTPADLAEVQERIDESLDQIGGVAASLPPALPVPMLGAAFEISLPLIVIDGVCFSGGFVNDRLVRRLVGLASVEIPEPLFEMAFESGGSAGHALIDATFSSWMLSTDLVKRLDLFLLALRLGVGIDLQRGAIHPQIDLDVPAPLEDDVAAALNALHLEDLAWSSFSGHAGIGIEIGPPFLRLFGDVRYAIPLSEGTFWWALRSGRLAAILGVVIRF